MLVFSIILLGLIALFSSVIYLHSRAAEREQIALTASFKRSLVERKSYAQINWRETEPAVFHRGIQ